MSYTCTRPEALLMNMAIEALVVGSGRKIESSANWASNRLQIVKADLFEVGNAVVMVNDDREDFQWSCCCWDVVKMLRWYLMLLRLLILLRLLYYLDCWSCWDCLKDIKMILMLLRLLMLLKIVVVEIVGEDDNAVVVARWQQWLLEILPFSLFFNFFSLFYLSEFFDLIFLSFLKKKTKKIRRRWWTWVMIPNLKQGRKGIKDCGWDFEMKLEIWYKIDMIRFSRSGESYAHSHTNYSRKYLKT